jgi:transposase
MNARYASVIALDTHARTITAKGCDRITGETKTKRFNDCPSAEEIASWIRDNFTAPHYCAYESGCTGFHLCRELRALGIDSDVIAVSSIARSSDDRKRKSDRKDASRLLHELLVDNLSLSRVWLPDEECEGVRDFLRCYRDVVVALKRAKQQTTAFLLRHGHVFNEKTPKGKQKKTWGTAFERWLDAIEFPVVEQEETLACYRFVVAEGKERAEQMMARIKEIAKRPRWKPYVDALRLVNGIEIYTALVYITEFGDFLRFKNGRSVSMWCGTTPKSHASGEKLVSNGHITKAGNSHVRTAAIEGCSSLGRRKYRPARPEAGQAVSVHIISECNSCNRRLINRHTHLTVEQKKPVNVAKVAVASEMMRWVWHIGCLVQKEQAQRAQDSAQEV